MSSVKSDQETVTPRVRLAWGRRGARDAAERGDILVVVDTLRFSTAAATAVHHGALIYPCATDEALYTALAQRVGGEVALHHAASADTHPLQPLAALISGGSAGARIVLPSPNGSTCSQYGSRAPALFVGALVNAQAMAGAVSHLLIEPTISMSPYWPAANAGAYPMKRARCASPWKTTSARGRSFCAYAFLQTMEAQVCAATFQAMRDQLDMALWECESGQELRDKGLGEDVRFAAQLNVYDTAPVLRGERLEAFVADRDAP